MTMKSVRRARTAAPAVALYSPCPSAPMCRLAAFLRTCLLLVSRPLLSPPFSSTSSLLSFA